MAEASYSVFDGNTFVTSNECGDLMAAPQQAHGFFARDTRFLSHWLLTLSGIRLDSLSVASAEYFTVQFFLVPPTGSIHENPRISVMRRRLVDADEWLEEIVVMNHADDTFDVELQIEAGADFADMFEIKDAEPRRRHVEQRAADGELVFSYSSGDYRWETRIRSGDCETEPGSLRAKLSLEPREYRDLWFEIRPGADLAAPTPHASSPARRFDASRTQLQHSLLNWLGDAPSLDTDWTQMKRLYRKSLCDLAALRFYPHVLPNAAMPAAGLPWFMALFGRDSLITSYQALPFVPELAHTTLLTLADLQATERDDFRDAEPGKILHELRFGELTLTNQWPHSPYYGTADATPLFLILLDEFERWTGDAELVRQLEPNARAALDWISCHGDMDGDGYIEYRRRNTKTGLENQCWKDSGNSILFADGRKAHPPIATCEIQGYVYDAKRRCARLAAEFWDDPTLAKRLEREAAELRWRFHEDFWLEERAHYALALDGEKRKVDSLTSNIGHLLWSGIVDEERADQVATHLMDDRLFSGWGIRTMALGELGYNPVEYHNGTVWPHDTSVIAHGLARYGYRAEAARLADALVAAAPYFSYRLPEVFAGYARAFTEVPVQYPTASSPQAWASGAPLLVLRALLGLEPNGERLAVDAYLPERVDRLTLHRVPGRWNRAEAVAS